MALRQCKTRACIPSLTSSFPVHIAMSSLHESRSRHLQTLSHTVYPSVAQKDENLTAPDQNCRGGGGAQSNQIWQLPPGFVDLCEGGHCHAESACLLDSCWAALASNAFSGFGGFWCTHPNWLSHLWPSHPPESLHQCPKRRRKELSWKSFFLVIADDAIPLTAFSSPADNGEPRWQKGLPLSIKTLQKFRTDGFPLTSVLGCKTSRNPSCAYLRISQSVNNCHCTSIADWKLYSQLPTCDALIRMNNVISELQHVWAGGCGRTPRPWSIMQLSFSTSWSLNSLNPASNGAPIDCTTSIHSTQPFVNVLHTFSLCH